MCACVYVCMYVCVFLCSSVYVPRYMGKETQHMSKNIVRNRTG